MTAIPRPNAAFDLLGAAVILTALGMTVAAFRGDGTAVNAWLFMEARFPHESAALIERSAVLIMLGAAIAGAAWRCWPLFLPAMACFLAEASARWCVGGTAYSDWAFMTHAARYVAPFALMLLLLGVARRGATGEWSTRSGKWALQLSLAVLFAVHGLEALKANPVFIDLIIGSAQNLAGMRVSEATARTGLEIIGVVDFLVAGAILIFPNRVVLGWAAFWAALTAFSRMTAGGWGAYPEVLLRASYFLGPIALWLLLARTTAGPENSPSIAAGGTAATS